MSNKARDNLINILCSECALYTEVLSLAKKKMEALAHNDTIRLKHIVSEFSSPLEKIDELEIKRKELIRSISEQEHIPLAELTLSRLASVWKEPRLETVKDELRNVMVALKQVNEKSTLLINQANKVYSNLRELLYSCLERPSGYNEQGKIETSQGGYFEQEV